MVFLLETFNEQKPKFPREIYEIGKLLTPEEKSLAMRGRLDLGIGALLTWDLMQNELRTIDGLENLMDLLRAELVEVQEKESVEAELVMLKDKHLPWYERERAGDYWAVANEMADVMVFAVSRLKLEGLTDKEVFEVVIGRAQHSLKPVLTEMIARTAALGMDLAEVMILKTDINMQHRDSSLLAAVRGDGFMKRIRKSIGNDDSQIPHLAQSVLGETVLTRLQAPAYGNFEHGWINLVECAVRGYQLPEMVADEIFGNLYSVK